MDSRDESSSCDYESSDLGEEGIAALVGVLDVKEAAILAKERCLQPVSYTPRLSQQPTDEVIFFQFEKLHPGRVRHLGEAQKAKERALFTSVKKLATKIKWI